MASLTEDLFQFQSVEADTRSYIFTDKKQNHHRDIIFNGNLVKQK